MLADVAQRQRAEHARRTAHGSRRRRRECATTPRSCGNAHAAEHDVVAGAECVHVEAMADARSSLIGAPTMEANRRQVRPGGDLEVVLAAFDQQRAQALRSIAIDSSVTATPASRAASSARVSCSAAEQLRRQRAPQAFARLGAVDAAVVAGRLSVSRTGAASTAPTGSLRPRSSNWSRSSRRAGSGAPHRGPARNHRAARLSGSALRPGQHRIGARFAATAGEHRLAAQFATSPARRIVRRQHDHHAFDRRMRRATRAACTRSAACRRRRGIAWESSPPKRGRGRRRARSPRSRRRGPVAAGPAAVPRRLSGSTTR